MKTAKYSHPIADAPKSAIRNPQSAIRASLSIVLTTTLLLPNLFAADWPRWGGNDPGRNMYSPATGLPDHFDVGKFKKGTEEVDPSTTKNVKWVAQLGSQAFGNVVVSGGKVFIGTNNENPRDPQHVGDRSI